MKKIFFLAIVFLMSVFFVYGHIERADKISEEELTENIIGLFVWGAAAVVSLVLMIPVSEKRRR